jgi:2-iminobutanoate/2-iminopropanoate deaminase
VPLSAGIESDDYVFVSGQVGRDNDGNFAGESIEAQTEQVIENIETVLEAAGSSLDDVVKTTVFLTDRDNFGQFNEVYSEMMPEPHPARSAIIVDLASEEYIVEIEAIAER